MREVRTCDFCGDDATGTYEPLPPSIGEPARLLLCDGCRSRLSTIVDPLLAEIGEEPNASVSVDDAGPNGRPASTDPRELARDGAVRGRDANDLAPRSRDSRTPAEVDSSTSPAPEPGSTGDDPTGPPSAAVADVSESRDASGRPKRDRGGTPRGYRKVMRFLENRELPIEREEAERLAVEAYDLDSTEVAECIDHAVQYGRIREVGDRLNR